MDNDELMELAEVIYTAWREQMAAQTSATLWPWVSLFRWEQRQWFTIAAKTLDAVAEIGHLRPV